MQWRNYMIRQSADGGTAVVSYCTKGDFMASGIGVGKPECERFSFKSPGDGFFVLGPQAIPRGGNSDSLHQLFYRDYDLE